MDARIAVDAGIDHKFDALQVFRRVKGDFDGNGLARFDLELRAAPYEVGIHFLPVHGGGEVARRGVFRHLRCRLHIDAQRHFFAAVIGDFQREHRALARDLGDGEIDVFILSAQKLGISDVQSPLFRDRDRIHVPFADVAADGGLRADRHAHRLRFGLFLFFYNGERHFGQGDAAAVDGGIFIDGGIEHHLQALRAVRRVVDDLDDCRSARRDLEGRAAPVAVGIHRLPVHGGGDVARLGIGRDLLVRHHVDAQSQRFAAVVGDFGGEGIVVFGDGADVGDVHVLIRCALDARISDVHGVVLADGDGVVVALHGDIRAVDLNGGVGTAGHGLGHGFRHRIGRGFGRGCRSL